MIVDVGSSTRCSDSTAFTEGADVVRMTSILLGLACLSLTTVAQAQETDQNEPLILGQIITVAGYYCPRFTDDANGAMLVITQHPALYSLLGNRYGGDGVTFFALPDLRGRTAIGEGQGVGLTRYDAGATGGQESVILSIAQLPAHNHVGNLVGSYAEPDSPIVKKGGLANFPNPQYSRTVPPSVPMAAGSVTTENTGGGQPVPLRDPFVALHFCIVTHGAYPSH